LKFRKYLGEVLRPWRPVWTRHLSFRRCARLVSHLRLIDRRRFIVSGVAHLRGWK
jgi:hypothetical protein